MADGVRRSKDLNSPGQLLATRCHERAARYTNNERHEPAPTAQSKFKKWWAYFCLCGWVKHFMRRGRSNWVLETRGTLMLAATVIATVTFQIGINPPGGVWQQDCEGHTKFQNCTGKAIFSDINPNEYELFLSFNTTSLVATLSVVLLVTMLIAVTFLLSTYFLAMDLVTSDTVKEKPMITWILFTLSGI
ncbi:hypothetical protein F2P56_018792 [Juglans regia]|uniref:PGG domain-containing protein n=2 Tax=Juglans regia TaxID=51240 RepID=A0A833UAI1_JUGRE|nr:uncharacterized protein LOC109014643 [Juglans regia]KAF5462816.1 hypothetical protein F2P56_018792 [Juglans regia]